MAEPEECYLPKPVKDYENASIRYNHARLLHLWFAEQGYRLQLEGGKAVLISDGDIDEESRRAAIDHRELLGEYLRKPQWIQWRNNSGIVHCRQPMTDGRKRPPFTIGWRLANEEWRPLDELPEHWGL